MERKQAHQLLLRELAERAPSAELAEMELRIEEHLALRDDEKQAAAGALFYDLARLTAKTLLK
jgi:hypothetical protein